MSQAKLCQICDSPDVSAGDPCLCPNCTQLLRWFRGHFADLPNFDPNSITPATRFIEDLGMDSLDHIDWLTEAQSAFNISLPTATTQRLRTVRDYLAHLHHAGARWSPDQHIRILKNRRGHREWIPYTEPS